MQPTEASTEAILSQAKALYQPGAYALFDADGTLWRFDIADRLFEHLIAERALLPEALPCLRHALSLSGLDTGGNASECFTRLRAAYEAEQADEALTFATMARALCGMTLSELTEHHRLAMERVPRAVSLVFPEVRHLWHGLRALGFRLCVVSASPVLTVEYGLELCGLKADAVRGASTRITGNVLSDELAEPLTYREGKLLVAERDFGRWPTVGFGDSRGDIAFLSACALQVLVNPRPALIAAAAGFSHAMVLHCPETKDDAPS